MSARASIWKMQPLWWLVAGYWLWLVWACAGDWTETVDYNYGWFVPPLALYFLWKRMEGGAGSWERGAGSWELGAERGGRISDFRRERSEEDLRLTNSKLNTARNGLCWLAWVFLALSVLVIFPLELARQAPMHWRFYPWVIGLFAFGNTLAVAWLTGGRVKVDMFLMPALFALTSIPWPTFLENAVAFPLMGVVTAWSAGLLHLLGYPATVAGNVITLPNCTVGVEEACSGLRSLQTALMVGLAAGELKRFGAGARLALLVLAFGLALVGNQVRVLMLALAGIQGGSSAVAAMHDTAGYAVLGILLGGVAMAAWVMGRLGGEGSGDQRSEVRRQSSEGGCQRSTGGEAADGSPQRPKVRDQQGEAAGEGWRVARSAEGCGSADVRGQPEAKPQMGRRSDQMSETRGWGSAGMVLLGAAVVAMIGAHAWYWLARGEASRPVPAMLVPKAGAGFVVDKEVPAPVLEMMRPDDWSYIRAERGGRPAELVGYHFYWKPGRGNARQMYHRPDACMPGAGWRIDGDVTQETLRVGKSDMVFNVFPFRNPAGRSRIYWAAYLNGQPVELDFQSDLHLATTKLWDFVRKGVSQHSYEVAAFVVPDNGETAAGAQSVQDFANRVFGEAGDKGLKD